MSVSVLAYMTYAEYLASPRWRELRAEALARAGGRWEDASSLIETFEGMAQGAISVKAQDDSSGCEGNDEKAITLVAKAAVSVHLASQMVLLCQSMAKVLGDNPERVPHEAILYAYRNKLIPKIPAIRKWMNTSFDGLGDKAFPAPEGKE